MFLPMVATEKPECEIGDEPRSKHNGPSLRGRIYSFEVKMVQCRVHFEY
jgi:hypothetical protein